MTLKSRWQEARRGGVAGAGIATFLGLVVLIFGEGLGLSRLSYDLPFALRPDVKRDEAVIIYMDEDSHENLHQEFFQGWNRLIHAQLLDRLKAYSVKAVAFDILFDTPTTTNNDSAFAKALQNHGRVVLGAKYAQVGLGGGFSFSKASRPIEEFERVAAWGLTDVPVEDEIVRQHHRNDPNNTNVVSLPWRLMEMTRRTASPHPLSYRWLNYYGPPGTIPWVSYVRVLSNDVPLTTLSNKVVLIGALVHTGFSGGKGTDDHYTPYSRWTGTKSPGVEINATAYLNLIHGEWLTRLSPLHEFLLVLSTGMLFGFGLNFFRPVSIAAISVGAMVLVFAVAYALMWRERVWFPWAILSGVQIPCAGICAVLFRTQHLHKEKEALEGELATLASSLMRTPSGTAGRFTPPGSPTPSMQARQQMREHFNTPSPGPVSPDAPTQVLAPDAPAIADCALLRRIGSGAYGEVWLGTTVLGGFRAIKIVYRKSFHDDRPYEREFDGIKNFDPISRNHPGLVHLLHVGRNDADGYFYYVMELADDCAGQWSDPHLYEPKTLGKELHRRGRLPLNECIQIGLSLTDSLNYLHEHGLIHRDIKPANIIFVDGKAKLADIGLVTQIGDGRTFVGTEGFYPPEGPGSPGGDIYSLGKVLYEALTGLNRQHFPDLPTGIDAQDDAERFKQFNKLILRACESNVRKRYTTARQMYEDLQRFTTPRRRLRDFFKKRSSFDPKKGTT